MSLGKTASFILRAALTAGALWLTFSQISLADTGALLARANPILLLLAVLSIHAAQWFSAMRTRYYLSRRQVAMDRTGALKLHYIGALFNAFLPGGTGGDAYKAWWLKHHAGGTLLSMVSLMIANRLNGMWILGVLTVLFALMSPPIVVLLPAPWTTGIAFIALGTAAYHAVARFAFREPMRHQYRAGLYYSAPVQLLGALAAAMIVLSLSLDGPMSEYLLLYMIASMVAMLPLSIGGVGLREFTLLHGAPMLGLNAEQGVAMAFAYTLLSLTVPLTGGILYALRRHRPEAA